MEMNIINILSFDDWKFCNNDSVGWDEKSLKFFYFEYVIKTLGIKVWNDYGITKENILRCGASDKEFMWCAGYLYLRVKNSKRFWVAVSDKEDVNMVQFICDCGHVLFTTYFYKGLLIGECDNCDKRDVLFSNKIKKDEK